MWSRGLSRYVAVWPLVDAQGTTRGVLIYDAPQEGLDQTLAYLRYGILGAILTSVLLAGAASLLLTRRMTRPLSETRDAAIRVASGDYAATVPIKSRDELGEVAQAFNYMAEEIEHYVGEIQEQKSRLEAVLEASPEALDHHRCRGLRDDGEPAAAARCSACAPRTGGARSKTWGRPARTYLQCVREAAANGMAVRELDLEEKAYWSYAAQMNREDAGGNSTGGDNGRSAVAGIIVAVRDITEHRSLEKSKTDFVSDVSHELRTPLATIQSAIGLLERASERLDPLEHRALELADRELQRIAVDGRGAAYPGPAGRLAVPARGRSYGPQQDRPDGHKSIESKSARFGIEVHFDGAAEHRCVCDVQKLYQVFLNLLDNAIKYSDPGDRVDVAI